MGERECASQLGESMELDQQSRRCIELINSITDVCLKSDLPAADIQLVLADLARCLDAILPLITKHQGEHNEC